MKFFNTLFNSLRSEISSMITAEAAKYYLRENTPCIGVESSEVICPPAAAVLHEQDQAGGPPLQVVVVSGRRLAGSPLQRANVASTIVVGYLP